MESFLLVLLIVFLVIVAIGLLYAFDKAEDISISDKEKYAKEIKNGEAVFIPASLPTYRKYIDILTLLLFNALLFYIAITYFQPILDNCDLNKPLSLNLLIGSNAIWLLIAFLFFLRLPITLFQYIRAKKTGWDGHTKKASYDRVILKFNKEIEKTYKGNIKFEIFLTIVVLITLPNWSIIKQSSSFEEANKLAYEQCMAKKNIMNKATTAND